MVAVIRVPSCDLLRVITRASNASPRRLPDRRPHARTSGLILCRRIRNHPSTIWRLPIRTHRPALRTFRYDHRTIGRSLEPRPSRVLRTHFGLRATASSVGSPSSPIDGATRR